MTVSVDVASVELRGGIVRVRWGDGASGDFTSLWLRDNLGGHRDAHSGQRLIDVMDLPAAPRLLSAQLSGAALVLSWQDAVGPAVIETAWLRAFIDAPASSPERVPRRWLEGGSVDARREFAWAPLAALQTAPRERLAWLTRLLQDGIAFVDTVPCTDAGILAAMEPIGCVSATNYGLVFDVRAVPRPENLAYSDLGLGLHTDNPYREPVPGFQALHALVTAPDGGASLFADGFALAEHLRAVAPRAFDVLARTPVPFHYRSADAELYAQRPLIELSCTGEVAAVHYNSRSMAPLRLAPADCDAYYAAYREFAALLREPRFQAKTLLADGEVVVFDNRRILHGRTGFESARHPRHLRGCYLTRDSVYGAAALLRRQLGAHATSAA